MIKSKPLQIGGSLLAINEQCLNDWINGDNPGPLVVEAGISHGCNHDCVHCGFQQFSRYRDTKHFIDRNIFLKFMKEFKEAGGIEIYFAGNGEPLLHPDIGDFFCYGKELGLRINLSSNGILLNEAMSNRLLPVVNWIRFSVNGGNPEAYATVHKCDSTEFDILKANLIKAVEIRNEHNFAARLVIQFLVYELNWKSIHDAVAMHKTIGTDLLIFRNATFNNQKHIQISDHILDALKEVADEDHVQVRWDTFQQGEQEPNWSKCYGINFRTNLNDKGELFTCFCTDCVYGNITQLSLSEIWNSQRKRDLFSKIEQGVYIPECHKWCPTSYDNCFIEQKLSGGF